jgi:hypothetical protein
MAIGDDALAAGMALVNGASVQANTIDTEINRTRDYVAQRTSAVTPVLKGGTGATTAAGARTALSVPSTSDLSSGLAGKASTTHTHKSLDSVGGTRFGDAADVGGSVGWTTSENVGVFGHIYVPNSTAASSGWTAAYINGDGRLCRGASSLRYKKYVSEVQPSAFGNIFPPLNRFQMRGGDSRWTFGHIAETLAENPDTEAFVMYDADGRPDSVDYIPLLLAKIEQLNARLAALEAAP